MMDLYPLFRPLLFAADPEAAHSTTFAALDAAARLGLARAFTPRLPADPVTVMGIAFPNRVGLAAGLDKNAAHLAGLATDDLLQLLRHGQLAEAVEQAFHKVDLCLGEGCVDPHAAHAGTMTLRRLDDVVPRRAGEVRVVEDDTKTSACELVVKRARKVA